MKGRFYLLYACIAALCLVSVKCHNSNETQFLDEFVDEKTGPAFFYDDNAQTELENIYAGPLKPTNENELIVVSRDNVQQLIKTLMLAYTHSKDPTMMQILKSGGLGAMRTTFKHLGKEEFGESFIKTAQMFIEELNLEKNEEELLGQFAEEYLEKHKFKIVVPESFLLHEKEMIEFLAMKKKMDKKKGRSMSDPEPTKDLELSSILPYDGKQFSTSIIPGIDLTWLAVLGGMIAIPYYFWSENESSSNARKDVIEDPLPSLAPPRFSPGPGKNEIGGKKHPKRRRPSNGLSPPPPPRQRGKNKSPKHRPGSDSKSAYDKQYRNWYNNHFFQQFNQLPPGVSTPPGGGSQFNIVPGLDAGNLVGHRPPGLPHIHAGVQHLNPVGVTQGAPPGHQALIGAHVEQIFPNPLLNPAVHQVAGLLPPPSPQTSPRVEVRHESGNLPGQGQNGLFLQQGFSAPQVLPPFDQTNAEDRSQVGVLPQIIPSANRREIIGLQVPQQNSILNEELNTLNLSPPSQSPPTLNENLPTRVEGESPGPFVPTHIEDQTSGQIKHVVAEQLPNPHGHHQGLHLVHQGPVPGPFGHHHPIPGVSFPPAQRVRWRAHNPLAQQTPHGVLNTGLNPNLNPDFNPSINLGAIPGPNQIHFSGVTGPNQWPSNRPTDRAPASSLVSPLVPPPPPREMIGCGEDKESFGSFKTGREGNTHFKVSFEEGQNNRVEKTTENSAKENVSNDSQVAETVNSASFVVVRPQNVVPTATNKEEDVLDLSKSQWQKSNSQSGPVTQPLQHLNFQQQNRLQYASSHARPIIFSVGNRQPGQNQPQNLRWQVQHQQKQQHASLELKEQLERERQEQLNEEQEQRDFDRQQHQEELQREQEHERNTQQEQQTDANQFSRPQYFSNEQNIGRHQPIESEHPFEKNQQVQGQTEKASSELAAQFTQNQNLQPDNSRNPQKPLSIQHFLEQQELRHMEYLKHQERQDAQAQSVVSSPEKGVALSSAENTSTFRNNDAGGFVPIYGPPTLPHGLIIRSTTERYELPKPSAFLDKLKAEKEQVASNLLIVEGERVPIFNSAEDQSQKSQERTSGVQITRAKPVKLSEENFANSADFFLTDSANQEHTTTPPVRMTTAPPALFVQRPTARTGVPIIVTPYKSTDYRVVTSKSVVTSKPIPLDQKFQSAYKPYYLDEDKNTTDSPKVIVDEKESQFDPTEYPTEEPETIRPGNGHQKTKNANAVFDSLEELLPNYEQDYRQVLRGYQRKQLEEKDQQQVYDQVVKASEQLEDYVPPALSKEVLQHDAAGFVNNNEEENSFDVNRSLKTDSLLQEEVEAGQASAPQRTHRNSKTDANIPIYSLDPFYGPRLSRIDAIFFQMKLDEDQEGCREQVVCNMYKNPDVYTPLSDFLSRQLTVTLEELQKPQVADERILRFFRYLQAARTGQDGGDCQIKYSQCAQDTTRLAHKPILDAFHKVSGLMSHENL
ncbi:uncharacterized protein LOC108678769 [Hyalella azteca]|uniref:Uncharacterized protein LOC108678769 n=1 Tax=Hyalella azteca TaxID=294128 RepID=A0A8B7PAD5_HYAAZ|nr:uncharacterized protein LOC108678769 [Hyalella azteca]